MNELQTEILNYCEDLFEMLDRQMLYISWLYEFCSYQVEHRDESIKRFEIDLAFNAAIRELLAGSRYRLGYANANGRSYIVRG